MQSTLSGVAIILFIWAAVSDITRRRIPNRLVTLLALAALTRLGFATAEGEGLLRAACDIAVALAAFGAGALFFRSGLLGGGDVKLLAAGTLWLGAGAALPFLAGTALAGGVLALGFLLWLAVAGRAGARPGLPYGVAIAASGVLGTISGL